MCVCVKEERGGGSMKGKYRLHFQQNVILDRSWIPKYKLHSGLTSKK